MREPSPEQFHRRTGANRALTCAAATRPPFLVAALWPVLVGAALVRQQGGAVSWALLLLTAASMGLLHAGANVLNDYFDGLSGADERNAARVFPFTGGSRFIQNGVLSLAETRTLGALLLAGGGALGLLIAWLTGPLVLAIGLAGGLIAIAYTGPLCLACRGLGDVAVALAFGLLPVAGTTLVLMGQVPIPALWAGGVVGCFAAAILWANSIPDIASDRAAGKLTLPARLGTRRAALLLPGWFAAGLMLLVLSPLPRACWIALAAAVPAAIVARAAVSGRVGQVLPMVIATYSLACALLTAGLLWAS